jgi:hypothetical protein
MLAAARVRRAPAPVVVVCRLPYQQTGDAAQPIAATPYKSVVIYNGGFTLDHILPALTQKLKGFIGRQHDRQLTHIVADGQSTSANGCCSTTRSSRTARSRG